MPAFSIVIVCKNEEAIIGETLKSLEGLTDDIVVYDNGSTDATIEIVKKFDIHLYQGAWEGYGKTKRKANTLARYDWILSLDADEAVDDLLKKSLQQLNWQEENVVYDIAFKNYLGNKLLRHGEWGRDHHIRLFNRKMVNWGEGVVHEQLLFPSEVVTKKLEGYVHHKTMKDTRDYAAKMLTYSMLNAEKYFLQKKKASWFKIRIAPAFSFFSNYILRLGFLDGDAGYLCAKMTAYYTFLKYARLKELWEKG